MWRPALKEDGLRQVDWCQGADSAVKEYREDREGHALHLPRCAGHAWPATPPTLRKAVENRDDARLGDDARWDFCRQMSGVSILAT